jgi:DME family drug/metabolite transporter
VTSGDDPDADSSGSGIDGASSRGRAALAVMAAAFLFGTTGTSRALLAPDAPGPGVAAMRLLVGAAGLVAFVAWRGNLDQVRRLWHRPVVWAMGLAVAGYQAFFFIGTARTGVAVAALIALGSAPFLAGLLGWALKEGAPGWAWAVSTTLAVAGLGMLMAGSLSTGDPLGMLAALAAGACYAAFTVVGVGLTREQYPGSSVLASSFSVGALVLLPAVFLSTWWLTTGGLVEVLWLGIGTTTVAYLLFGVGLGALQPGHIATLTLLEPAVATILGVVVLHEPLSTIGWIGCLMVIGALALLGVAENRRDRLAEDQGAAT